MESQYYPWDVWFDGDPHTLTKGIDYKCETPSMVAQMYTKAAKRGIKVSVKRDGDELQVARKPAILGQSYHLVEDYVKENVVTLLHESARRKLPLGEFLVLVIDDGLDVYKNQTDEEIEGLLAS